MFPEISSPVTGSISGARAGNAEEARRTVTYAQLQVQSRNATARQERYARGIRLWCLGKRFSVARKKWSASDISDIRCDRLRFMTITVCVTRTSECRDRTGE
ncbi:hypothetical protein X777_06894 [Ooceraea biroi]|uniref:Uncharacterized protein n=1 Tax=Ooceraea biroi TaxID=2015173 RepID=A0A026WC45_OOCBI|nr:hypothetical protein X777_06894 [Ooceraea biroi]